MSSGLLRLHPLPLTIATRRCGLLLCVSIPANFDIYLDGCNFQLDYEHPLTSAILIAKVLEKPFFTIGIFFLEV
jgi:hypothetical protein